MKESNLNIILQYMNLIKSGKEVSKIDELKHIRDVNVIFNKNSFDIIKYSISQKKKYRKLKKLFNFLNEKHNRYENNAIYDGMINYHYKFSTYKFTYKGK